MNNDNYFGYGFKLENTNYLIDSKYSYSSSFGIYSLLKDGNPSNYLLKTFVDKPWISKFYQNESKYLKTASDLGISPHFIYSGHLVLENGTPTETKQINGIIIEKYGEGTLTNLYDNGIMDDPNYGPNIKTQIKKILYTLYSHGIYHNDLHTDNFLYHYDIETDTYIIKVIDFGISKNFHGKHNEGNYSVVIVGNKHIGKTLNTSNIEITPNIGGKKKSKKKNFKKMKTIKKRNLYKK